jgi:uncharacterized membrane protein
VVGYRGYYRWRYRRRAGGRVGGIAFEIIHQGHIAAAKRACYGQKAEKEKGGKAVYDGGFFHLMIIISFFGFDC